MLVLGIPGLYCECQDGFHLQELTLVNNTESVLDLMIAYIYICVVSAAAVTVAVAFAVAVAVFVLE